MNQVVDQRNTIFLENLKSLLNIYNVMALIQDYDKLCLFEVSLKSEC
jgi:hypothetical protein